MIRPVVFGLTAMVGAGLLIAVTADAATPPSPLGAWARADGGTRIKISHCGKDLCAVNTWVKDPGGDEAVGDKLVMTLKPKSDGELEGTAYDEKRKSTYDLSLTLNDSGMKTQGCVVAGVICKEYDWTRAK